jgi:hypothetical protein
MHLSTLGYYLFCVCRMYYYLLFMQIDIIMLKYVVLFFVGVAVFIYFLVANCF